jgi:hypothetical protein
MAQGLFNLKQVNQAIQQGGWSAQRPPQVEYLVVAGGGSGGGGAGYAGGGGGAGGLLAGMDIVPNGQSLVVTIGAGGVADAGTANGTSGGNSAFGQVVAVGGGYGSYGQGSAGASGGSGGGNGGNGGRYGQGTPGQGNIGGLGFGSTSGGGGGGGGAGAVGAPVGVYSGYAGNGGVGVASVITGTVTAYAGGGGGAATSTTVGGAGGLGGGGAGATGSGVGSAGTANTGGGGGGSGNMSTRIGGNGGSGIVAISYPDTYAAAASTTGSPTVSTSGSGSILNTTSSCITYPNNAAFDFGASAFTIEGWVYSTVASGEQYLYSKRASATFTPIQFGLIASGASNRVYFLGSTSGSGWEINSTFSTGSIAIPINTWVHIALVRSGNTFTSYVNGVADLTVTVGGALMTNSSAVSVGASVIDGSNAVIGYYTNVRVVKGVAVYTSAFTPSTTPLTAVSGTSLLMSAASGSIYLDRSTNCFTPTKVGTSSWNQLSPFATGLGYKNRVYTWTSSGSITF